MPELTLEYLKSQLRYDPNTGLFWRLAVPPQARKVRIGDLAGHLDKSSGYVQIGLCSRVYKAHRLAWFYMTGEWPPDEIDHKDLDRSNNRWSNLRLATHGENQCNRPVRVDSKTGLKGVAAVGSRFRAYIGKEGGGSRHLGYFDTLQAASDAYATAAVLQYGEYARP